MIFDATRYFLIGNLSNNKLFARKHRLIFSYHAPGRSLNFSTLAVVLGVLLVLNIAILILSSSVFAVADSDNIYRECARLLAPDSLEWPLTLALQAQFTSI